MMSEQEIYNFVSADIDMSIIPIPSPQKRSSDEKKKIFAKFREKYGIDGHRNIRDINNIINNVDSKSNYLTIYDMYRDDLLSEFILYAIENGYTVEEFWKEIDSNIGYSDYNGEELCFFPKRIDLFKLFIKVVCDKDECIPVSEKNEEFREGFFMKLGKKGDSCFNPKEYEKDFISNEMTILECLETQKTSAKVYEIILSYVAEEVFNPDIYEKDDTIF